MDGNALGLSGVNRESTAGEDLSAACLLLDDQQGYGLDGTDRLNNLLCTSSGFWGANSNASKPDRFGC